MCDANQPASKEHYNNVQKYKEPKMDRTVFQRKLKKINIPMAVSDTHT